MDNNELENEENYTQDNTDKEKKKKRIKLILIFIIVFIIVFCLIIFAQNIANEKAITPPKVTPASTSTTVLSETGLPDNPIDFNKLQLKNNEIYAWIKIDDTKVDYPIAHSKGNDEFYLNHNAEDKEWSPSGAVFTQSANNLSFTDPITLVYGHNGYSDTMFTTLHYFENEDFFDNHPYFNIYTPHHILKYQVISAFKYDDRHIMNSFDFSDEKVLTAFQQNILDPKSAMVNKRGELDVEIDKDSKIVILSTCITGQKSSRYLVCGVLVSDEKTN